MKKVTPSVSIKSEVNVDFGVREARTATDFAIELDFHMLSRPSDLIFTDGVTFAIYQTARLLCRSHLSTKLIISKS